MPSSRPSGIRARRRSSWPAFGRVSASCFRRSMQRPRVSMSMPSSMHPAIPAKWYLGRRLHVSSRRASCRPPQTRSSASFTEPGIVRKRPKLPTSIPWPHRTIGQSWKAMRRQRRSARPRSKRREKQHTAQRACGPSVSVESARGSNMSADLILRNGLFTTLDRANPTASAVAITNGGFTAVGRDADVMQLAGTSTRIIDLKGRRALPGLIDNHLHIIRGGLNFNMELRWDGVRSLADALAMLKRPVGSTPPPAWVRVVGGFTAHQFAEKRLPTIEELNAVAPDMPVFLLHLYDRAILNGAALRAVGYTKDTPDPPAGEIVRDAAGNPTGLLVAKPN